MRLTHTLAIVLLNAGLASCGADAPSATSQGEGRAGAETVFAFPRPPVSISEPVPSKTETESRESPVSSASGAATALDVGRGEAQPTVALRSADGADLSGGRPGQSERPVADEAPFATRLARAAENRTRHSVLYDPAYVQIDYPMGDVAADRGVCIDVIIRTYRALGVDLQVTIHEDMAANFSAYPALWGLSRTDHNIDHRRVPNLETFLARAGAELPATNIASDYQPGDIVTYRLPGNLPHAAVVSTRMSAWSGDPMIVHNIGRGPRLEDRIFEWPVHRHYRWRSDAADASEPSRF